jgi:electron transport complex protein RnfD
MLLIGFAYLLVRRIISPIIPLCFIGSAALFTLCLGGNPLTCILSGGLLLGAVFMATDYVTSPMTKKGMVIYAVGIGLITMLIRTWGSYPEGMSFAILIMNALVPLIDKFVRPKRFGAVKSKK